MIRSHQQIRPGLDRRFPQGSSREEPSPQRCVWALLAASCLLMCFAGIGSAQKAAKKPIQSAAPAPGHADDRTVLRRLNRSEYEHTLCDLLDIRAEFKDLLAQDVSANGFD